MFEARTYRHSFGSSLKRTLVIQHETDLQIFCDQTTRSVNDDVKVARGLIETMIEHHPEFLTSFTPLPHLISSPFAHHPLIKGMIKASNLASVGPMAAVAGAIAMYVGECLAPYNHTVIVENGGDLYLHSDSDRNVLIDAGSSPLSNQLMIHIPKSYLPLGVCTSSGTVGHSFSFGKADAVVIVCKDAAIADALATAICNRVKEETDIEEAVKWLQTHKEILFAVIIKNDKIGVFGELTLMEAT